MKDYLHHLFLPNQTNNHRAKAIQPLSILVLSVLLLISSLFIQIAQLNYSSVLGISTSIDLDELLALTNQQRVSSGLDQLNYNQQLSNAAAEKAKDMFEQDYWAHNSPNGTTPWVFIKSSGYDYLYAGENLARGFTTSEEVVNAWMDSQGHRENILSKNYKEIGFAVTPGTLNGTETVLVVQMFGSPRQVESQRVIDTSEVEVESQQQEVVQQEPIQVENEVASVQTSPIVNSSSLVKNTALFVAGFIFLILILDILIIKRKNVYRVVAHNFDTLLFLSIIIAIIVMIGKGSVL